MPLEGEYFFVWAAGHVTEVAVLARTQVSQVRSDVLLYQFFPSQFPLFPDSLQLVYVDERLFLVVGFVVGQLRVVAPLQLQQAFLNDVSKEHFSYYSIPSSLLSLSCSLFLLL